MGCLGFCAGGGEGIRILVRSMGALDVPDVELPRGR
jgi:hypothetical protein